MPRVDTTASKRLLSFALGPFLEGGIKSAKNRLKEAYEREKTKFPPKKPRELGKATFERLSLPLGTLYSLRASVLPGLHKNAPELHALVEPYLEAWGAILAEQERRRQPQGERPPAPALTEEGPLQRPLTRANGPVDRDLALKVKGSVPVNQYSRIAFKPSDFNDEGLLDKVGKPEALILRRGSEKRGYQYHTLLRTEGYEWTLGKSRRLYWRTSCLDCGVEFSTVTGCRGKLPTKFCEAHRRVKSNDYYSGRPRVEGGDKTAKVRAVWRAPSKAPSKAPSPASKLRGVNLKAQMQTGNPLQDPRLGIWSGESIEHYLGRLDKLKREEAKTAAAPPPPPPPPPVKTPEEREAEFWAELDRRMAAAAPPTPEELAAMKAAGWRVDDDDDSII